MKSGLIMLAVAAGMASADVYNDNSGNHLAGGDVHDFFYSQGFLHLDILSVSITNDANNLYVSIQTAGDLDATNWGTYVLGIAANGSGSATDNPWGRNISWGGQQISHWIGTWANDNGSGIGGQVWSHDGANWSQNAGLSSTDDSQHAAGRQVFSVAIADLGLAIGDTIRFDVASSGGVGNPPGVDHLSRADFATDDWGNISTAGSFLSYTLIPSPSAVAVLGLGGLLAGRRRR